MPIRMLVLVRRKAGLTPKAFRKGYENSHARMAVELFGHLWLSYRRSYLGAGRRFGSGISAGMPGTVNDLGIDAISEYVLRDEAALAEMGQISLENLQRIKEDEARWFDQVNCWSFRCDSPEEHLPHLARGTCGGFSQSPGLRQVPVRYPSYSYCHRWPATVSLRQFPLPVRPGPSGLHARPRLQD